MNTLQSLFSDRQRIALSADAPTPLYHQLYTLLKKNILNGTLANQMQMPTEQQLSETFKVSRITAKRAMDELANEGLVERKRGKGTHVTHEYIPGPVQAPLVAMLQEIEAMARHSEAKVLELGDMQPPADIRDEFNLNAGETALRLVRVRSRENQPFGHYLSWTVGLNQSVEAKTWEEVPRLEVFRDNGLDITHVKQTLTAIAAPLEVANVLGVEQGFPLLSMVRRSYDSKETLVDYMQVLYHPERFQYQMDLSLDKQAPKQQ